MIILGIDPGLAIVGWGVLDYSGSKFRVIGYGSLQTPAGMKTEDRLAAIYQGMIQLIDTYHPEQIAVEELFFNTNITTGIRVAEALSCLRAGRKMLRFLSTPHCRSNRQSQDTVVPIKSRLSPW